MLLCSAAGYAYNIKAGPLQLSLAANVSLLYSDNANISPTDPKEDWGIDCGPIITGGLQLPVHIGNNPEELLRMTFSTGFMYRKWLNGGQQVTFQSPTTFALSLPLRLGQWLVTVGDLFTFTNEALENLVAVGIERPAQYNNTATLSATRPFGRFVLTLSGSRTDRWSPESQSLEETVYSFSVIPSVYLNETMSVFWATSVGFVYPEHYIDRSDGFNLTSMVGIAGRITPVLDGSIGIGYVHSRFDPIPSSTSTNNAGSGVDGVSAQIGLNYAHPLRPNTTHSIRGFYSPGVTATMDRSNYQTTYGVNYNIAHRLNRAMTLSPSIGWMHSKSESGPFAQQYDMLMLTISIQRTFTRRLTGNLTYRRQDRTSDLPNQSYVVNEVRLSFLYTF